MAKARGVEVGDWSESGTFLRKPVSGWLHDDRDLMNSGITYKIHVGPTRATYYTLGYSFVEPFSTSAA